MSDFVQTMKDWRRMCRAMLTDYGCNNDCQLLHISPDGRGCDAIYADEFSDNVDWSKLEQIVKKWAAEHPGPVYPTWGEWLMEQMVIAERMRPKYDYTNGERTDELERTGEYIAIDSEMKKQIPADIAEKLGIEPKEG